MEDDINVFLSSHVGNPVGWECYAGASISKMHPSYTEQAKEEKTAKRRKYGRTMFHLFCGQKIH